MIITKNNNMEVNDMISKRNFFHLLIAVSILLTVVACETVPPPSDQSLPGYYRVRLIPEDRDSLSKIAGYDCAYGDITKWQALYDANKDILVDSENPDLIHPGQRIEIPARPGETRSGECIVNDGMGQSSDSAPQ